MSTAGATLRSAPEAVRKHERPHYVSLFWRLFIPNATVLGVACAVLWVEPANGRIVALAGGLAMLLCVNWVLMRRAVAPLLRLVEVMEEVDPLQPGRRLDVETPPSEVAILADAFNEMLARLEDERRESARRADNAQQEERRRISRELHDEIGQALTAHSLSLDRIATTPGTGLEPRLAEARDETLRIIDDVRTLAQSLRPDVLDNIGLTSAMAGMLERLTERTGLEVRWTLPRDLPALDDDVELVIYRVAQEATTNVVRHAAASTVEVELAFGFAAVTLTVRDDGRGIDRRELQRSSGGLRWMRERALTIGASVSVRRRTEGGTEVQLVAPLSRART